MVVRVKENSNDFNKDILIGITQHELDLLQKDKTIEQFRFSQVGSTLIIGSLHIKIKITGGLK